MPTVNALHIKEAMADVLHKNAVASKDKPALFLEIEAVFGNLKESAPFLKAYSNTYQNILNTELKNAL